MTTTIMHPENNFPSNRELYRMFRAIGYTVTQAIIATIKSKGERL